MTKENIEKITTPNGFWNSDDISVEEKKKLADYMEKRGLTTSTFYLRFFKNGFAPWEIMGIDECKRQFLLIPEVSELLLNYKDESDEDGDKGYLYVLAQSDSPGVFYSSLKKANRGLCLRFFDFMNERGMSMGTVIKRFTFESWRRWEKDGIHDSLVNFNKTTTEI